MQINFITSNKGKIITLNKHLKYNNILNVDVIGKKLGLVEPQADSVTEISKNKALQVFDILKQPVLVEDGGFYIEALNNFPDVYVRYILDTIGVEGIIKLMEGVKNRKAVFCSCATYVDKNGKVFQFENDVCESDCGFIADKKAVALCPHAWSDLWYIYKPYGFDKTLAEFSETELDVYENTESTGKSSIENFVR